jgi:hypothetical protein
MATNRQLEFLKAADQAHFRARNFDRSINEFSVPIGPTKRSVAIRPPYLERD